MDSEELSILVAPLSLSTQSAVSDRHFLIWEKSAYLAEVSVTDITEIFQPRNPGGTEHACTNSVYLAVFPPPPGNEATTLPAQLHAHSSPVLVKW